MTGPADVLLSRRSVLQGTVSLVVAVTGERVLSLGLVQQASAAENPQTPLSPTSLDAWLVIDSASRVTAFFGKIDLQRSAR